MFNGFVSGINIFDLIHLLLQLVSSIDNASTVDLGQPHLRPVYQSSWLLVSNYANELIPIVKINVSIQNVNVNILDLSFLSKGTVSQDFI